MQHPNPSDHALHDAILVAGHAAGDLGDADRARADATIAACATCAELRRDLVAIAAATRSVPAPAALHRDLRITDVQAGRLRRGSWLRTVLRPFAAAGSPVRPVAAAFTSLGIVGLLVGVTLTGGTGAGALPGTSAEGLRDNAPAAASVPGGEDMVGGDAYEAERTPTLPLAAGASERAVAVDLASGQPPRPGEDDGALDRPERTSAAANATEAHGKANGDGGPTSPEPAPSPAAVWPSSPLIAGSLGLLGIGLLLFGLRLASRRIR